VNELNKNTSFKFPKAEKLCERKNIDSIFESGSAFYVHPVKVYYQISSDEKGAAVQVLISIPKRNIKKAVDRNRLKRIIRECYRLQKNMLSEKCLNENVKLKLAFIYTLRKPMEYHELHEIIFLILQRLTAMCFNTPETENSK
jgi:ribonuclease P protein component